MSYPEEGARGAVYYLKSAAFVDLKPLDFKSRTLLLNLLFQRKAFSFSMQQMESLCISQS